MERELMVVEDVAAAALGVFMAAAPKTMVLSGGSTPEALYRRLAAAEYPWEGVEFFFGDERCVPVGDPMSNARMADEALLSKVPSRSYPMDGQRCDSQSYERTLRRRFDENLLFDMAIYGLGPDGHTASLFPGKPGVDVTDRWVVNVPEAGFEPFVPRISLTVPALSAAKLGMFLVSGTDKHVPLRRLLAGEDIPASRVTPARLIVLADREAAES